MLQSMLLPGWSMFGTLLVGSVVLMILLNALASFRSAGFGRGLAELAVLAVLTAGCSYGLVRHGVWQEPPPQRIAAAQPVQ